MSSYVTLIFMYIICNTRFGINVLIQNLFGFTVLDHRLVSNIRRPHNENIMITITLT